MPKLQDKRILILSPQNWGRMFLSKHHYAIELAKRGNTVFFLNPPEQGSSDLSAPVEVRPFDHTENLFLVRHKLWFPYKLKFHALPVFHAGMRLHLKKVLKAIGGPVDIIWSFDLGNLYPLKYFTTATCKIFHPVDEPLVPAAIDSARGADIIFSVTQEILEKYQAFDVPRIFINHGVTEDFLTQPEAGSKAAGNKTAGKMDPLPIRVGLSGNLVRPDLDRETLLQILDENPDVVFECWGSYSFSQSNIGGSDDQATTDFINGLKTRKNIILHGTVPTDQLAGGIHRMDAFLICYDINKDQSRGTNYHKIMEYLSTGKVIVSNNVTTYKDRPVLLQMTEERDNNRQLPGLFRNIISKIREYNSVDHQQVRVSFARENTYGRQLERISDIIEEL